MSDHEQPCDCWLCRGGVPDDLVERIKKAKPMGEPMNLDEALRWVASIGEADGERRETPLC